MSEISDAFPDQDIGLNEVRHALHVEFDLALDALLLDLLGREPMERMVPIVIYVAPALLKHAQELLP